MPTMVSKNKKFNKDNFLNYMKKKNINCRPVFYPIELFKCYKKFFKRTPFPSSPDTTDSDSSSTDSDSSSTDNDSDNSNEGGEERLGRIRSKIQSMLVTIEISLIIFLIFLNFSRLSIT
jgi:hypothetical protein